MLLLCAIGKSHWICVVYNRDEVNVLDSLGFMNLQEDAVLQIAKLYSSRSSTLNIKRLSVQQQNGYHDCGLFSVAYAVEVCLGQNPESASFAQDRMRGYLLDCLSSGAMKSFPTMTPSTQECIPRPRSGVLQVKLFCHCKLPAVFDAVMIQCDVCEEWYHFGCVKLDPVEVPKQWQCPQCVQ